MPTSYSYRYWFSTLFFIVRKDGTSDTGNVINNDLSFTIEAKLKPPRNVHGSHTIVGRWNHIGLVAGGTGIAPLIQIASLILNSNSKIDPRRTSTQDILYKEQLERWAKEYPNDFFGSYSLTGNSSVSDEEDEKEHYYLRGRGSAQMI